MSRVDCTECEQWIETVHRLRNERDDLTEEVYHLQGDVSRFRDQLELKEIECEQVTTNLAELAEYVQELETALAEAHLTSKEEPTKDSGTI